MRENDLVRRLLEIEVKTCLVSYLHSVFSASVLTKASKENRTVKKKKKKKTSARRLIVATGMAVITVISGFDM